MCVELVSGTLSTLGEFRTMKHLIYLAVGAVLLLSTAANAANHTDDTLDDVRKNLAEKKAVLIDVREPSEWKRGHLQDATLVPLSEIRKASKDASVQKKLETSLPKDRIIYCHCGSGVRVLTAAAILGKQGYDIRPLASGFDDLVNEGFPAAKKP